MTEPCDAIELAGRVAAQLAPDLAWRVQAELVLWVLKSTPAFVRDAAPAGIWVEAHSTDWATREGLWQVRYALDRVLGSSPQEIALADTVHEIVRAAGLWRWDELLSEVAAGFGDADGRQHAQEVVRDAAVEEAQRALSDILRGAAGKVRA